jgi:hypothetical protein
VASGGGLAAFLGPIPGILDPKMRDKWLITIRVAAFIALGTWFATSDLQGKLEELEAKRDVLQQTLNADTSAFETVVRTLPRGDQDDVLKLMADRFLNLWRTRQYIALDSLSHCVVGASPMNEHALYFSGEAFRELGRRGEMLGAFNNYLYQADHDKDEAYQGDRNVCYTRSSGYCAERTASINHLMANDAYAEVQRGSGASKIGELQETLKSIRYTLDVRPCGFNADLTTKSSGVLLAETQKQLADLGQPSDEAAVLLSRLQKARLLNCPEKMPVSTAAAQTAQ